MCSTLKLSLKKQQVIKYIWYLKNNEKQTFCKINKKINNIPNYSELQKIREIKLIFRFNKKCLTKQ